MRGYDDDDLVEVAADETFYIGRGAKSCKLIVIAEIGDRKPFAIFWRAPSWVFKVNDTYGNCTVDGDQLGDFASRPLRDGSEVEIRLAHAGTPIHRFRVELGD